MAAAAAAGGARADGAGEGGAAQSHVRVVANDGGLFEIPQFVARDIKLIHECLMGAGDGSDDDADTDAEGGVVQSVTMPGQGSAVLKPIIDFCVMNHAPGARVRLVKPLKYPEFGKNGVPDWALSWLELLSTDEKFDLLIAANELMYDDLTEFMAAAIAHQIRSLTEEQEAATFALTREFTPEQEEQIRQANLWAEEA